jgi:Zn ribbon nucleic-acid-binding protein
MNIDPDSAGDLSGSEGVLGSINILHCAECGQQSAATGEASRWSTVAADDDGASIRECLVCGTHQKSTDL